MSIDKIICNLAALKSYFDRKVANAGSIVEELVERNSKTILLFTKKIPKFRCFMSAEFSTRLNYCRKIRICLVGTS